MPRVGLVHRDRPGAVVVVGGQPRVDLLRGGAVRRVGHEEVPDTGGAPRRGERRRCHVVGDRQHRPAERRRRHDLALLPLGHGDQLVLDAERPRLVGRLAVEREHRLRRGRVVVVEALDHGDEVVGAAQRLRPGPHVGSQLVVRGLALVPQRAGAVGEALGLGEQGVVELLPDRPVAAGLVDEGLDVGTEPLVGRRPLPRPPRAPAPPTPRRRTRRPPTGRRPHPRRSGPSARRSSAGWARAGSRLSMPCSSSAGVARSRAATARASSGSGRSRWVSSTNTEDSAVPA